MRAVTLTTSRRILVGWHWSAAAYFYFVSALSLTSTTDMSLYGLLAALVLGVATIVARSNAYASCMRSASKKYAERVASALNKLSAMFGLITLFFVGAYVASKLPMNLPVRVHHNTLMALLGYLMFLGGKWVLVPPRYSTAARRARND